MEEIDESILFVALTRPAMLYGVPLKGVIMNGGVTIILFLAINNPFILLFMFPIHFIMYLLALKDPMIFDNIRLWAMTCAPCLNRGFWKGVSYSPSSYIKRKGKITND